MVKQRYPVIWEDEAKDSLRRIYNYIKNRESVNQAIKVRNRIIELGTLSIHKNILEWGFPLEPGQARV